MQLSQNSNMSTEKNCINRTMILFIQLMLNFKMTLKEVFKLNLVLVINWFGSTEIDPTVAARVSLWVQPVSLVPGWFGVRLVMVPWIFVHVWVFLNPFGSVWYVMLCSLNPSGLFSSRLDWIGMGSCFCLLNLLIIF